MTRETKGEFNIGLFNKADVLFPKHDELKKIAEALGSKLGDQTRGPWNSQETIENIQAIIEAARKLTNEAKAQNDSEAVANADIVGTFFEFFGKEFSKGSYRGGR